MEKRRRRRGLPSRLSGHTTVTSTSTCSCFSLPLTYDSSYQFHYHHYHSLSSIHILSHSINTRISARSLPVIPPKSLNSHKLLSHRSILLVTSSKATTNRYKFQVQGPSHLSSSSESQEKQSYSEKQLQKFVPNEITTNQNEKFSHPPLCCPRYVNFS